MFSHPSALATSNVFKNNSKYIVDRVYIYVKLFDAQGKQVKDRSSDGMIYGCILDEEIYSNERSPSYCYFDFLCTGVKKVSVGIYGYRLRRGTKIEIPLSEVKWNDYYMK